MPIAAELRQALRSLGRAPLYSVGVVVTLALALAASIVAATIVDRVLLRPLPLQRPSEVVDIKEGDGRGNLRLASFPTFEDWRTSARSFTGLAFVRGETMSLGETGARQRAVVALVSSGFFEVAGIAPRAGRAFAPAEERRGGGGVALISEAVWAAQFGRDPSAIGRSITLDGTPFTVVGVVGTEQRIVEWAEIWVPLEPEVARTPELQNRFLHVDSRVVGRLATGTSVAAAQRELSALQRTLSARFTDPAGSYTAASVTPLVDTIVGNTRPALGALAVAGVLVLLLACANVGGLALLRTARRQRELAVRTALGAPFRRLVRQLVTESVVLALVAGTLGTALAAGVMGVIRAEPALGIPRAAELAIDGRVLAGSLLAALLLGVGIGLLPAWRLRAAVSGGPRFGRGAVGDARGVRVLRAGVTVVQLALSLTLLVGSALLLRSFGRLQEVDLGYRPHEVVAFDVYPPGSRYAAEDAARSLYRRLVDRVATVPGVVSVGFVNHTPLGGWITTPVRVPGVEPDAAGADVALYKTASEGYADVMGLRVERGRWFTREDVDSRTIGVVVSASVARRFWPGADPIGRTLTVYRSSQARPGFGDPEPSTVLGVVADVRHFGPANAPAAEVYLPFTREAWGWGSIVVRSTATGDAFRRGIERAILEVEPDLPVGGASGGGFRTMTEGLDTYMAPRRIAVGLAGGVAGLVLLVASLGLYALAGYSVSQRTGEFGVRMALGATPGAIVRGVLGGGVRLVVAGLVTGTVGAVALGRVLATQLVQTSPADPLAFAVAALCLGVALLLALWVPARRASRLDPTVALRSD